MNKNGKNKRTKNKVNNTIPPSLVLKPKLSAVFRFRIGVLTSDRIVTRRCLLSIMATGTGTGNYTTIFSGIKLKRIEFWSASTTNIIDFGNIAIEWQDPRGPSLLIQDTGTSVRPGHINTRPPKNGSSEMWSSCNATFLDEPLFFISGTLGSIVDIYVSAVLSNGPGTTSPEFLARTSASLLAGTYFAALDNATGAGLAGTQVITPVTPLATIVYT